MKLSILCFVALSLVASVSGQIYALAVLRGSGLDGGITGTVTFSQVANGNITMTVNVTGITVNPNALHGIHIHTFGDLSDQATAQAVGGHWATAQYPNHGCPDTNSTSRHLGDTGNWQATAGSIVATKTLDLLTLSGIDSIIGRGVILHANTDDCATVASSGGRIAQGVIGIVNSTVYGGAGEASQGYPGITGAICWLEPASGSAVSGVVYLTQAGGAGAVTVYAIVNGLTSNHGFHLHWFGDISNPSGLATGGHYNPLGNLHGVPPYSPRHMGDMGIISYYQNTVAYYKYVNDQISLNGPYSVIGRAIHVHQNSDDCSNPVGSGGARYAQCVIGLWNNQTLPTFPVGVPETQNGTEICRGIYPSGPTTGMVMMSSAPIIESTDGSIAASVVVSFVAMIAMLILAL